VRKNWIIYLCASLTVVFLLAVNIGLTIQQKGSQPTSVSALPRLGAYNPARPQGSTVYDEQIACTFTQDMPSLSYTVTAVGQSGTDGYGPAYLVNGLGNTGYWYQVGLSYNWSTGSGFQLSYEVFNTSGNSIFPSDGGGGISTFSPVNNGDLVTLSLSFSNGNVTMLGSDQNTGAHAQETYSASGATTFVGNPSSVASKAGFWTGLMTEWYHTAAYHGDEQNVTYYDNGPAISSAWMWIDEISVSQNGSIRQLFSAQTPSPFTFTNPTQFQTLTSNGATESINATQFVTGGLSGGPSGASAAALTFGYSIAGGTGASSPPVLTYVAGGTQKTAPLTTSNQTFTIDSGTTWSITNPLSSSTSTERWQTSQATTGTAISPQTINLVFYHQYLVIFNFNIIGGGTGNSPPTITCQQFGRQITPAVGAQTWTDAAPYSFSNPLAGSSSSERWATDSAMSTLSAPGSIIATYNHQYYVTTAVAPASGGSISGGSGWFNSGAPFQSAASANSGWQFEGWTGSGQGFYSGSDISASVIVNAPLMETATFYPGLTITTSSRGSVSYSAGTITGSTQDVTFKTIFAPVGTTIQLAAKSKFFIYSFTGWTGSSTNNEKTFSVVLNSPSSLTANFSYNYVIIGIGFFALIAVVIVLAFLSLRRKRSKRPMVEHTL
jgi:Divergent InlB B-repeat domain